LCQHTRTCTHTHANRLACHQSQAQIFRNLSAVLEEAGSSLDKVIKVNVFLTSMENFAAVNEVYAQFLNKEPKPVRPSVRALPFVRGFLRSKTRYDG
jgi:enamine deaminase RidA (YjgF/YER057c/UK114 family)